eukprot:scaffold47038_cov46-Phaeocystis_antarctica.AAC.4
MSTGPALGVGRFCVGAPGAVQVLQQSLRATAPMPSTSMHMPPTSMQPDISGWPRASASRRIAASSSTQVTLFGYCTATADGFVCGCNTSCRMSLAVSRSREPPWAES